MHCMSDVLSHPTLMFYVNVKQAAPAFSRQSLHCRAEGGVKGSAKYTCRILPTSPCMTRLRNFADMSGEFCVNKCIALCPLTQ